MNEEFNLRHDWHSLLVSNDKKMFRFTNYSKENFPKADTLLDYLRDFKEKFKLNVFYDTNINSIECIEKNDLEDSLKKRCNFILKDQNQNTFKCK